MPLEIKIWISKKHCLTFAISILSNKVKDCFYTEARRDRLDEPPTTPGTSGTVPSPDHIKTTLP
jgi:hypothetical protein